MSADQRTVADHDQGCSPMTTSPSPSDGLSAENRARTLLDYALTPHLPIPQVRQYIATALELLNAARATPPGYVLPAEPLLERLAFEAMHWARANNVGADQPSLVFARRFAFLIAARPQKGDIP